MYTVYHYPSCSTCKKAIKWLETNHIDFELKHIVNETPNKSVLLDLFNKSNLPIKAFFNTSGRVYKERNLKDLLPNMSEEEAISVLASNGMLIKRPIITKEDQVFVGFEPDNLAKELL